MKIILNIATHGDEKIGHKVAKEIERLNINKKNLIVHVANKKAFELNKRFIDQDLNRSFPGKKNGNHEQRIAYAISPMIKSADIVIDIHSTTSQLKDALAVTNLNKKTLEYIKIIKPKHVLVMKITKNNALISQAKIGIAFEYGKDNDPVTMKKIVLGIKRLLKHLNLINIKVSKTNVTTDYFDVISSVKKEKDFMLLKQVKNYNLIKKGETYATNGSTKLIAKKDFYPILFGNKNYKEIFGFEGKKLIL